MRIYEGSPRQDFEEVLRSIGAYLDRRNMRDILLMEVPDGFIVQGLSTVGASTSSRSESMGQVVNGVAEARAVFAPQGDAARRVAYRREPVDVQVSPDWPLAYEEGQWSGHLGGADGDQILAGRYAAQWVLRDGHWLIRSEVFVALTGTGPGREFKAMA